MSADNIALKVSLFREAAKSDADSAKLSATEMRRFSMPTATPFTDLKRQLALLWGGNELSTQDADLLSTTSWAAVVTIEYIDTEGDAVVLDSEAEWQEAVAMYLQHRDVQRQQKNGAEEEGFANPLREMPLRMRVRRVSEAKRKAVIKLQKKQLKQQQQQQQAPQDEEQPSFARRESSNTDEGATFGGGDRAVTQLAADVPPEPFIDNDTMPHNADRHISRCHCDPNDDDFSHQQQQPSSSSTVGGAGDDRTPEQYVLTLISVLFDCTAESELLKPTPTVDFGDVVKRDTQQAQDEEDGDVTIDIRRDRLLAKTHDYVQTLFDGNLLVQAERVLTLARKVFDTDYVLPYNLACSYARRGMVEEGLAALKQAVALGFTAVEHLKNDEDLANLREDLRFEGIVERLSASSPPKRAQPPAASDKKKKMNMMDRIAQELAQVERLKRCLSGDVDPQQQPEPEPQPLKKETPSVIDNAVAERRWRLEEHAAIPEAKPLRDKVRTLLTVFPQASVDQAERALSITDDNLQAAVTRLLDMTQV